MLKVIQDLGKLKKFQCYCMYLIKRYKRLKIKNDQNDRSGNSSVDARIPFIYFLMPFSQLVRLLPKNSENILASTTKLPALILNFIDFLPSVDKFSIGKNQVLI